MNALKTISSIDDIPAEHEDTPIGRLLEFHNLGRPEETYNQAQLLVGMCMDNRKHLRIPDNFAYIIRSGGANLRQSEFKLSYAIAIGGVKHVALIGHNNCGMVNLSAKREAFVQGLMANAGWSQQMAEEHFANFAPLFEIGNEVDFVSSESLRLGRRYPEVKVAPMIYRIEDNLLYLISEE